MKNVCQEEARAALAKRTQIGPGQWTGSHGHPGNQLFIAIAGGTRTERRNGEEISPSMQLEAGSVGWLDEFAPGEAHDIGNTGETTIDIVLVTIK